MTNCGHSFKIVITNNGFGWLLIEIPAKLSASISGIEAAKVLKHSGIPCRPFIDNARSAILIFGRLMKPYFPPNAIGLWVRNPGKPIISNALIVPSDNGSPDSLEKRCHFRKNWLIILVPFGTLFIITMQRFRLIKQGKESFGFQDYPPEEPRHARSNHPQQAPTLLRYLRRPAGTGARGMVVRAVR